MIDQSKHYTHAEIGMYGKHLMPWWESEHIGWKLWYADSCDMYGKREAKLVANIMDTNHYGHQCHPPIYGFEAESLQCCTFSGGTPICGYQCRAACGKLKVPGAGGHFTVIYAGYNNMYGDAGKKGMVRVQYI